MHICFDVPQWMVSAMTFGIVLGLPIGVFSIYRSLSEGSE